MSGDRHRLIQGLYGSEVWSANGGHAVELHGAWLLVLLHMFGILNSLVLFTGTSDFLADHLQFVLFFL